MRRTAATLLFIVVSASLCSAQNSDGNVSTPSFKPIVSQIELDDGDTLVFLGDSITHQCLYTQYVEDYFFTRFPGRRIHFHNAGVGGDRARDALIRFDEDVAKFDPKYVTILLGMNDGTYTKFEPEVFATYEQDMTTLLDRLSEIGAVAVPMTPTMFDSRAAKIRDKGRAGRELRDNYYNDYAMILFESDVFLEPQTTKNISNGLPLATIPNIVKLGIELVLIVGSHRKRVPISAGILMRFKHHHAFTCTRHQRAK